MTGIPVGFEIGTAQAVDVEPTHLFIGGTTGTGKSELLRGLIERFQGAVLIIDVKRPRDYADFGADVPFFIEHQLEALQIKRLIESTEHLSIKKELPELIRLSEVSSSWEEMLAVAKEKIKGKIQPFTKDVLQLLIHLFERLVRELRQYRFASEVELPSRVNVMNLSDLTDSLQQIVVASVLRHLYRKKKNVAVVIDEAHRFIPEGMGSGSSEDVVRFIREGRANELWLWMADQTVTGIDKGLLKQMQVWVLGRQPEINEAKRTLDQIPQRKALDISVEDVQTLGLGEFIVVTQKWARRVYAWPVWISRHEAENVARGKMTAEEASKRFGKWQKEQKEQDEKMWKGKFEEQKKKSQELEKRMDQMAKEQREIREKLTEESVKTRQQLEERVKQLQDNATRSRNDSIELMRQLQTRDKDIQELKAKLEHAELQPIPIPDEGPVKVPEEIRQHQADFTSPPWQASPGVLVTPEIEQAEKESVIVHDEFEARINRLVDRRIEQLVVQRVPIVVAPLDEAIRAKITTAWMDAMSEKLNQLTEAAKKSARIIVKKGTISHADLYYMIRQRESTKDPSFARDYVNPLLELDVITKGGQGGSMHYSWALQEKLLAQFKGVLSDAELQRLHDWLLTKLL